MSDDELDRKWKPNGRPQSTMARSFSAALNDVFKIDNSLADLDAAVDQNKRAVLNQTSELEALEARLKATEERLKQRQSMGYTGMSSRGSPSPRRRAPLGDTFAPAAEGEEPQPQQQRNQTSPLATEFRPKTPTRPQTGKREPSYTSSSAPPMPGALPPTPSASEDDGDLLAPVPPPRSSHRPAS